MLGDCVELRHTALGDCNSIVRPLVSVGRQPRRHQHIRADRQPAGVGGCLAGHPQWRWQGWVQVTEQMAN